ncbi:NHLP-related RiPP peptide [Lysobacter sp. TAF61]|uniref:NHLP-related RiPP peptide n=1 Tax=Lysobacter sp. TAF61 TaxID=3233072 RepID=UPI003F9B2AE0
MQLAVHVSSSVRPVVAKPRTAPFDPVVADRLLALLSTDDAFRLQFQHSPQDALASIGFAPPAGGE